jgi:hypothetical protein
MRKKELVPGRSSHERRHPATDDDSGVDSRKKPHREEAGEDQSFADRREGARRWLAQLDLLLVAGGKALSSSTSQ